MSVTVDFSDLSPHIHRIDGIMERILEHMNPPEIIVGNETEFKFMLQGALEILSEATDVDIPTAF